VILDHDGWTEPAWFVRQRTATPINHHDASSDVAAHGISVSGVPSSSSSRLASGFCARCATTLSPSARISARRIFRASASASSRTNALSPFPCRRAAASRTARSSASSRIVNVLATAIHSNVPRCRNTGASPAVDMRWPYGCMYGNGSDERSVLGVADLSRRLLLDILNARHVLPPAHGRAMASG
jgi:hypothetical protein